MRLPRLLDREDEGYTEASLLGVFHVAQCPLTLASPGDAGERRRAQTRRAHTDCTPAGTHKTAADGERKKRRHSVPIPQKLTFNNSLPPRGCTVPGSTAIPGRCVEWTEQAPIPPPSSRNPFNMLCSDRGRIRY